MTIAETVLTYVGIPAGIYAVVAGLAALSSAKKKRVPAYQLGQEWTHGPVLWTATDEVVAGGGHGHHGGGAAIGGRADGNF